ncbi:MAG: antitoxin VapB family protein [Methanomicrobiales archaeon]
MKTITIREDTYHMLRQMKDEHDSFSDVIDRLLAHKTGDIGKFAGALNHAQILDTLKAEIREIRDSAKERV